MLDSTTRRRQLPAAYLAGELYRYQRSETHKSDAQDGYYWRMRIDRCQGCRDQETDAPTHNTRSDLMFFNEPQGLREADCSPHANQPTADRADKKSGVVHQRAEHRYKNSRSAC